MTASTERRPRVAILVVNGFRRRGRWAKYNLEQALRYPWIDMCLRQVERHSQGWDYEVFVFDNSHLTEHRSLISDYERVKVTPAGWVAALARLTATLPVRHIDRLTERTHPAALDHLAARVSADFDYIVTLDNDSFPVREDWLEVLIGACEQGAAIAGVYRDEMAPAIAPFIHVSGLCIRRRDLRALKLSFGRDAHPEIEHNQDVGQRITYALTQEGREIERLKRSNKLNYHFLIGGIYGDVIYHHGAGSRRGKFWTSTDRENDDRVNAALRRAAFEDLDRLIAVLRGQAASELDIEPV
jgi:hypothetical protein